MKKKIFKYFACMITVAILATTLLLSWVNYEMFKGRVMDDLEVYGRMFAVEMNGEAEAQSALHSLEEDIRVTLVHAIRTRWTIMRIGRKSGRRLKTEAEAISAIPAPSIKARSITPCG